MACAKEHESLYPIQCLWRFPTPYFKKRGKEKIALDAAAGLVENVVSKDITLWGTSGLHSRALELAAALDQPAICGAHYLALEEIIGCDLWSADQRFSRERTGQLPNLPWIGEF